MGTIKLPPPELSKGKRLFLRAAALTVIAVIGLGIGWTVGGSLVTSIRGPIGETEREAPLPLPATNPPRQDDSGAQTRDRPSREERLGQEALQKFNKQIEEAKRQIEKFGRWDEEGNGRGDRDKKAEREKKGHGKGHGGKGKNHR